MGRITVTTYSCDACEKRVDAKRDLTRVEVRVGATYRSSVGTVAELCPDCLQTLDATLNKTALLRGGGNDND